MFSVTVNMAVRCSVVMLLLLSHGATRADNEEKRVAVVYSIPDLPVWRVDDAGQPHFDASILISHLKSAVAPEKWTSGEAEVAADQKNRGLVVSATDDVHQKVRQFLKRKVSFARHDSERWLKDNRDTAALSNQRILLFAGDPNSKATDDFFDSQVGEQGPAELEGILGNFVIQCMTPDQAKPISYWEKAPSAESPRLAILRADGSVVAVADFADFRSEDKLDGKGLAEFLQLHSETFPDAKSELQAAIAKAAKEDKRVLVQMGGPNCGPCIMLSRYLSSQAELISKDYIHVKLDKRMASSKKLTAEYAEGIEYIPWMAILSSDGQVLANSISEEGNIAFPRGDVARDHFKQMLNTSRVRLTSAEVDEMVDAIPE